VKSPLVSIILLATVFLLFPYPAQAGIIFVAQDAGGAADGTRWENAYTTTTAGLVASVSGDEIWVKAGRYNEAITLKEGVALYGGFAGTETQRDERNWRANETVIDATGLNTHVVIGANYATLDGFTLTGGSASKGGGLYCDSTSPQLTNCKITGNIALGDYPVGLGGGVYCYDASPVLTGCRIEKNQAGDNGSASMLPVSGQPPCTLDRLR